MIYLIEIFRYKAYDEITEEIFLNLYSYIGGNAMSLNLKERYGPVSYTHLDVYKRQDTICPRYGEEAAEECVEYDDTRCNK